MYSNKSENLILDDAYIENCATVYLELDLYSKGILFWVFVKYPEDILAAVRDKDYRILLLKHSVAECKKILNSAYAPSHKYIQTQ